jgi:hypothetical protein
MSCRLTHLPFANRNQASHVTGSRQVTHLIAVR